MEVYILDSLLRRERVIDRFESLIWTERFNSYGDFELVIRSTLESRSLLTAGTRLALNKSYRVMTIETVEDQVDSDGKATLTVKGNSLESLLEDRTLMTTGAGGPNWSDNAPPADLARAMFHDICVLGTVSPKDVIPFIHEGTIMPDDTITEPVDPIPVDLEPDSLYKGIQDLCEGWTLGFRILRNFDASQLYFDVYAGNDRTSGQTILDPVIFAPNLDNLQNTRKLDTIESAKNVAYVFSPAGFLEVYPRDADGDVEGLERRVLMVKADDVTTDTPDYLNVLKQRGEAELAKNRAFTAFDGEINQNSQYKYGRDYILGDLVEMRDVDGVSNQMRVSEQIFVQDREGEREYPTLSLNTFVNTGSWLSQGLLEWEDYDPDPTTWAEMP